MSHIPKDYPKEVSFEREDEMCECGEVLLELCGHGRSPCALSEDHEPEEE